MSGMSGMSMTNGNEELQQSVFEQEITGKKLNLY
jgi:hypothetical protein